MLTSSENAVETAFQMGVSPVPFIVDESASIIGQQSVNNPTQKINLPKEVIKEKKASAAWLDRIVRNPCMIKVTESISQITYALGDAPKKVTPSAENL